MALDITPRNESSWPKWYNALGYAGAAWIMAAPFFLPTMFGLALGLMGSVAMIPQATVLRAWNFVLLDVVVAIGYTTTICRMVL